MPHSMTAKEYYTGRIAGLSMKKYNPASGWQWTENAKLALKTARAVSNTFFQDKAQTQICHNDILL